MTISIKYFDLNTRKLLEVILTDEEAENFNENEFEKKYGTIISFEKFIC